MDFRLSDVVGWTGNPAASARSVDEACEDPCFGLLHDLPAAGIDNDQRQIRAELFQIAVSDEVSFRNSAALLKTFAKGLGIECCRLRQVNWAGINRRADGRFRAALFLKLTSSLTAI